MQGGERWPQPQATNPSARLRAARVMPQWITARGSAVPPPPPPPPDNPPPIEPEYEVIEFSGQQTYSNQPIIRGKELKEKERKRCDLCGSSAPAVRCMQCVQQNFCYSCDEMYHRHPKRQAHIRKELEGGGRPPLPPKGGDLQPPPVPPPRRNKRATPRPQHSPLPPSVPPSPQVSQRDPLSSKTGLMGSLKRMIGGRQLPIVPHGIDHQNQIPVNSMMGFQDHMNCNGFQDWTDMQRGTRAGSFNTLNPQGFGHMMQTQSMAHLNCPSCQGHPMWNPWGGMPAPGTWQSSAFLNHCTPKEQWSDSDSDSGWHRERQRRFSTMSARMPRSHGVDDNQSMRGGRRTDVESSSFKGNRRKDFETMSNRGGSKRQDSDTMSLRGGRRNELSNSLTSSQRKFSNDRNRRYVDSISGDKAEYSESSDKESDDDFLLRKGNKAIMSDIEEMRRSRRKSESVIHKEIKAEKSRSLKGETKRNEKQTEIRRRSSPINNKFNNPTDYMRNEMKSGEETESDVDDKIVKDIGVVGVEEEEEVLGPVPEEEWECKHCTFVNEGGTRVCMVCCKTTAKPKLCNPSTPAVPPTEELKKKLNLEDKLHTRSPSKSTKDPKEKRGIQSPEPNRVLTSKGTSPPPQSISTQTYEEAGLKLKRATSLADYGDWRAPQRSASRHSLLSDTQSLPVTPPRSRSPEQKKLDINRRPSDQFSQRSIKRSGSQPPEYISSLVQKQVKQGLEMVKLLRDAEEHHFSAEDLTVALLHCGDGDPIVWLQENWRNMIDTVVTLGTNYGQERKENIVGTISATEARDALRAHDGNVWAAVTECVEQRQRKYAELLSRGNFSREDIVTVLTANHGNLEEAYKELNKNQLKPFLMRIWGPPQGADNDDGDFTKLAHGELVGLGEKNSEEVSVDLSIESNYDRIQNWLDHVNFSNKSRFSQSMLQLNVIGTNRSESEWKLQSNNKLSDNPKYLQNSDVHRYLTKFYNLNDKSLRLDSKNKYSSMQNLNTLLKTTSDSECFYPEEGSLGQNILSNISNKELENEIETITIKLKPIVVQIEDDDTYNSELNQEEIFNIKETKNIDCNTLHSSKLNNIKEDSDIKTSSDLNQNVEVYKANSEKSVTKESSIIKTEQSLSSAETSSESFESLHSEEENVYENVQTNFEADHHDLQTYKTVEIDYSCDNEPIVENYDRILEENNIIDIEYLESPINKSPLEEIEISVDQENVKSVPFYDQSSPVQTDIVENSEVQKKVDISKETEKTEQRYKIEETETFTSTKETTNAESTNVPTVGGNSDCASPTSSHSTMATNEDNVSDDESKSSTNFVSSEMPSHKLEPDINELSSFNTKESIVSSPVVLSDDINPQNEKPHIVEKIHHMSTEDINTANHFKVTNGSNHLEMSKGSSSKSDSDINEEASNEFSKQSVEYNDDNKKTSPINANKREQSCQISDVNSDKDVSSIPTDSEGDIISSKCIDNNYSADSENNSRKNNAFHSNQMELIDLLKKSLTKDEVVERIVSTLFASVLQISSNETQNVQELNDMQQTLNNVVVSKEAVQFIDISPSTKNENLSRRCSDSDSVEKAKIKEEETAILIAREEEISNESSIEESENEVFENHVNNENMFNEPSESKPILLQREARRLLAEGLVMTYDQAELALQLKELNLDEDDGIILAAANECDSLESAIAFIQQECQLCAGKCTVKQMISMLECEHRCCLECASNYFTLQITERSINDCTCPFCKEPDILNLEEEKVLTYFSNLDILLKGMVKENIHELFQRKLRDRTLMQDPNFKWCVKCSSGYIANPRQKKLMCPDCKAITCANCMKPWEKEHEKMSCDEYKAWSELNDPDNQLARHLDENGVTCPNCRSKYILAKGGCMHLTCPHCKHEFCSGCSKPFLMGKKCSVSEYCERLGLHSHHPRNCLFYLRDKEPEELEKLLEDNNINYKNEDPVDTRRCNVQLLKETPEGLMEGICGYPTIKAGFCRTHYVESLVTAIRYNRVDPVKLLDYGEALQELRRHGKDPPERPTGMSEYNHRQICLKVIEEEIPLD